MFNIDGYSLTFRRDRDKNGGGVLVYVREGILCRELKTSPGTENIEVIFLEINLRKTKWLVFAGYNNCQSKIGPFLQSVDPTICGRINRPIHQCRDHPSVVKIKENTNVGNKFSFGQST